MNNNTNLKIDFNKKYVVEDVEWGVLNDEKKYHVFRAPRDVMREMDRGCYLIGRNGTIYSISDRCNEYDIYSSIHKIAFDDQEITLPIGTTLYGYVPRWRKDWPSSELIGFTYHSGCIPIGEYMAGHNKEVGSVDITIDESNIVKVLHHKNYGAISEKHEFVIEDDEKNTLFKRLSNIVNSESSYSTCFYDDTIRHYEFIFKNGDKITYNTPIGNGVEYINEPLEKYVNAHTNSTKHI